MSFNLDDPLAGILSDGSDDSFFDDDKGKKKPAVTKSTPIAEKKNALFDLGDGDKTNTKISEDKKGSLFDLGPSDSKKVTVIDDVKTSKSDLTKSPGPFRRTLSKESIKIQGTDSRNKLVIDKLDITKSPTKITSSADKLDIFGESTAEPKKEHFKALEKGKSSQSLLDDILGGSSTKTGNTNQPTRPATAAKNLDFDFNSIIGKKDVKQTIQKAPKKTDAKIETPKDDNVAKKNKSSDDWLGIFDDQEGNNDDDEDGGMPAWLVGDSKKKKPTETVKKPKEVTVKEPPITSQEGQEQKQNDVVDKFEPKIDTQFENVLRGAPSSSVFQNSNEDITAEGAALYLQQQESQLMVALQLKAQEEKLAAMQVRQKETHRVHREAALAQHAQLDAMLQRQADQRQQMQAVIAAHQERITQRIKALLGTSNIDDEDNNNPNDEDFRGRSLEKKESPHMKEKKQLLQLVHSLQENHDKEIDLMETSYRRQLAFLELSVSQSEERMREESDKLVKFYTEKIGWLDEQHMFYKKLTEDNLHALTDRYKVENEMIRQQHLDNVKVLQEHHAALMENIKNAVKQEQFLIQDSASFSSDLQQLVTDVKESKSYCQQLVENVQALTENTQRDNDRNLQTRESHINDMIQYLKKERENFEVEKSESRDMVKMLEIRLKQMTTMIEEETASLKQKKMDFEFEKATFSKQTEFAKNVLKKQDEEIKMLKEDILKEYQEKIIKIDEEKSKALKDSASLAKEKASIQSLKQELEKTKVELHAQLEEITEERTKLNLEKQQMHMEEQRILAKSRDLDLLAKSTVEKQSKADMKYSEAEFIQRKYEDRIRRIQEHVVSLNAREKQIAKEKVALSRERLNIHNERKQVESRQQCSLCKTTQNMPAYNYEAYNLPDTFLNVPVSRDYGSKNVNSAMNAIEQEMAHLMSRNFSLRHTTTGIGNFSGRDERMHERGAVDDNFHATPTQVESGVFKDFMDPKFMMLRLDVQQVLSNLDHNRKDDVTEEIEDNDEE